MRKRHVNRVLDRSIQPVEILSQTYRLDTKKTSANVHALAVYGCQDCTRANFFSPFLSISLFFYLTYLRLSRQQVCAYNTTDL